MSETEKNERLSMLYEINRQLRIERGLTQVFHKVVELTYNQLNSEEVALFIHDEQNGELIKVAVRGPSENVTAALQCIDSTYRNGESLVGWIFQSRTYGQLNLVPSDVQYYDQYLDILPSRKFCHYIGVPVIIGDDAFGVLRVINKKAPNYSVRNKDFELSASGFDGADLELLQTIASQVALAIRSAQFLDLQRYYQQLVETSPDPIIVLDNEGKVKVFNKASETLWGYSAGEVIGKHVAKYCESERQPRETGRLLRESPSNRIQDFQTSIKDRQGEVIPIRLSASLLFDMEGRLNGSIGIIRDMRETLRHQEEKAQGEKLAAIGRLAATSGHDIKHHIATALNYIDALAFDSRDDAELTTIYRFVHESLSEAVDKLQNMLMVGRPRSHQKQLTSATSIFAKLEPSMKQRAASKEIILHFTYPDDKGELEADDTQIRQMLLNLFENSIDAIEEKKYKGALNEEGLIEVSGQAGNGNLRIMWKDNGCGIPNEMMSRVFTAFATDKPHGNGLGLFLVKSIVEDHGGHVSVDSEEGRGTSFEILLPLLQQRPIGNS